MLQSVKGATLEVYSFVFSYFKSIFKCTSYYLLQMQKEVQY
jgi:hypothetical protein